MATAERDLYDLLGVARGASDSEIKKAFRRLARELHPDVSPDPEAAERFKEVAQAYEVLSNAETRRLYDQYGHAGLKRGGYTPTDFDLGNLGDIFAAFFGDDLFGRSGRGAARGADVQAVVAVELQEAFTGTTRRVELEVASTCDHCGGDGSEPGSIVVGCPTCGGTGRLQQVSRSVFGEFVRTQACPSCGGRGSVPETRCGACDGAGRRLHAKALDVDIPQGIHHGQQIRIRGEGHAGAGGGPAGDVYVEVHVAPDARFERDGDDVLSTVDLTIVEAALGATVTVPTLEGDVELEFEPGTQPGEVRVLRGKGLPALQRFGRGDQRVFVNVVVPRRLTAEQRSLLEQFEQHSGDDTYRRDGGFFEKLKSALR
ncbi:MAG TPA: molecular chaperone DnaJ [Gaiellaceae bacterium]|jgi:molecular chaperone DnaJ|nr:molecular chaperone DnaJ [Gaiellaceae bacterium]